MQKPVTLQEPLLIKVFDVQEWMAVHQSIMVFVDGKFAEEISLANKHFTFLSLPEKTKFTVIIKTSHGDFIFYSQGVALVNDNERSTNDNARFVHGLPKTFRSQFCRKRIADFHVESPSFALSFMTRKKLTFIAILVLLWSFMASVNNHHVWRTAATISIAIFMLQ
jgi:hypothetical protein